MAGASGTLSELAPSEIPVSELGEATPAPEPAIFPPYPPYATEPAPPSVADTIIAGRDLRLQHKSLPRRAIRPPPKPARPKGPKATDVKLSRRAARAHARCLRKHGAVLTDRLERIAKPPRRTILYLWRERADTLPAETISRLRSMLDADEPFKPDQAYEYFINVRKMKKRNVALRINQIKKDAMSMCGDKRFLWARNATVAFARGIQQRLSRPGRCVLANGMLRLSNIILYEICGYMHTRPPLRQCNNPKAKFMMEVADKIAVWIDEILSESEDRMLMMDFDEDEDILRDYEGGDTGFDDDFLNMMGDGRLLTGPQPAYLKFTGEMLEAFTILTDSMYKKGDQQLLSYGKFCQSYKGGADELKSTPDFDASEFNTVLAQQVNNDLSDTVKPSTPKNIATFMKDVVNVCSNYLAQHAEFNKDKGQAFKLLVYTMRSKPNDILYHKEKVKRNYGKAASELEDARGLESDHDDPNLSQEIYSTLSNLVAAITPDDLTTDMKDTLDISSKYLSQRAIDEIERGPAFDILIKELETHGGDSFSPQFPPLAVKFAVAYTLKSAPGLSNVEPNTATVATFASALHNAVDSITPKFHQQNMNEVIGRCANYLSAFIRDRDKALQLLLKMMKSNSNKEVAKRNNYSMNYGTGATETETAPILVPFLPVKDIADEGKQNLTNDMENLTPSELRTATKALIQDVARYLSQSIALRSGAAGERYPLNFLASVKKSLGTRPLFKYKAYGQTYSDAAEVLKYAGPLESDPKCEQLQREITTEMKRGVPIQLAPAIVTGLNDIMVDAAKHLAKIGMEKGQALEYLLGLMKEQGETPLGQMQGYEQSYKDGARRIENAPNLTNDKVDKGVYESVRGKLTKLVNDKPSSEFTKVLPGIVDESAKFLASPMPETESEKRRVLADLMGRKGERVLAQERLYKLTYTEGGDEIMKAPVGEIKARDEGKRRVMHNKLNEVIPDKRMQELLKDPANEGAAYLADIVKGRGEAMQVLHDKMKSEKDKDFLTIGKFKKNHDQAANMLDSASHFGGQHPSPVILDKVKERMDGLPKTVASNTAEEYMKDTSSIISNYIAGVATKECGLDTKALATMDSDKFGRGTGVGAAGVGTEFNKEDGVGASTRAEHVAGKGIATGSSTDKSSFAPQGSATMGAETEEERQRRLAEEDRKRQEEKEKRRRDSEKRRLEEERRSGAAVPEEYDPEREQAMQILHKQLRSRGGEVFYKQPQTELTQGQASLWLGMKPPMAVDKAVKESADTARLHKKFERKLSTLVSKVTPADMRDTMQDVIIESSRILSEYFVSNNYKALVREALISEMQKRGNEILIELDGTAETFFYAAQRLKKSKCMEVKEPCSQIANFLIKKLDDMIRCHSMPRKLTATMKDHIKDAADYLSEFVTKSDGQIEAYVSLLGEMEATGDALLIEGVIPKSYKAAAAYLRRLTSFEDQINRPKSSLQSSTESKLKNVMANIAASGYTKSVMDNVISNSTRLLVSYIMLQDEKTEVLKILIQRMEQAGDNVLLRHGHMRKSYSEGANRLQGKNTDQLGVPNADPVVARKIQIKLNNLMRDCTPDKYLSLMNDVIEDATMYLAIHFLQPHVIQVCKCMKNVFVQCELWCDEILRRIARPCCTCSRHVSAQALEDLASAQRLHISPSSSRALAPGLDISFKQCPTKQDRAEKFGENSPQPCPAPKPTDGCQKATTSYLMYSTEYTRQYDNKTMRSPTQLPSQTRSDSLQTPMIPGPSMLSSSCSYSPMRSILFGFQSDNAQLLDAREKQSSADLQQQQNVSDASSPDLFHTVPATDSGTVRDEAIFECQIPTALFASIPTPEDYLQTRQILVDTVKAPRRNAKTDFSSRAPIISTDQMSDWHAMVVSLMWNVQAWRDWIQENIDRALAYKQDADVSEEVEDNWITFHRRVTTEALQWRQYNKFSRQLTLRLALRYRDKKIVSPTRATNKTEVYMECQKELLDIIHMFNKWTQWLMAVIKEADSLQSHTDIDLPMRVLRWSHFKKKVEDYYEDWKKYNIHLTVSWENRYRSLIMDWLPTWQRSGPVWVVSACGAVPRGAVTAGIFDEEVVWVARTTHKCNILPAALHPSKHCCLVYADGAVHHYTKYQVMCNATVSWVAWRAGAVGARAVHVASGVHVGRVHYRGSHLVGAVHAPNYRCHVVIFGRPFAFNCYELLVLASDDNEL